MNLTDDVLETYCTELEKYYELTGYPLYYIGARNDGICVQQNRLHKTVYLPFSYKKVSIVLG